MWTRVRSFYFQLGYHIQRNHPASRGERTSGFWQWTQLFGQFLFRPCFRRLDQRLDLLFYRGIDLVRFLKICLGLFIFSLVDPNNATINIGVWVARLDADHLAVIVDSGFEVCSLGLCQPAVIVGVGVLGLQVDRCTEVGNGLFLVSQVGVGNAAIVVSVSEFGIENDGFVEVIDSFILFVRRKVAVAAVVVTVRILRVDAQGFVVILYRRFVTLAVKVNAAAIDIIPSIIGTQLDGGRIILEG